MNIFVTGASGFIGSNFVIHAANKGHRITALKRNKSVPRIKSNHPNIQWLNAEINDLAPSNFKTIDALIHLSSFGVVSGSNNWEECYKINVFSLINLLDVSKAAGVRRFVIVGSCFEYGNSGSRFTNIPVTAPLQPTTAYSSSKASASMLAYSMAIEKELEMIIARPFHVYGPGEDQRRFYPQLTQKALSGQDFDMTEGGQIRDFQHVDACSLQLLYLVEVDNIKPGCPIIVNLGTGTAMSLREFAEREWKDLGAKGVIKFGALRYRPNEVLRFVPEVNLPI